MAVMILNLFAQITSDLWLTGSKAMVNLLKMTGRALLMETMPTHLLLPPLTDSYALPHLRPTLPTLPRHSLPPHSLPSHWLLLVLCVCSIVPMVLFYFILIFKQSSNISHLLMERPSCRQNLLRPKILISLPFLLNLQKIKKLQLG